MNIKFEQAIVHNQIAPFRKPFYDKWNFKDYKDIEKPLVIFGYLNQDKIYESHKGYKLIIPSNPVDIPNFENLRNHEKTILCGKVYNETKELLKNYPQIIYRDAVVEIKDNSRFKPNPLGNKIYYYSGFKEGWGSWKQDIIKEIQKNIDFEIITTNHNYRHEYYNEKYLKGNYYDKAFLNINLSKHAGMTTVREMGLMGRKTITMRNNIHNDYSSIINCKNIEEVIKSIKEESKKIGTMQKSTNPYVMGNEWLNINYWVNKNR